ncbi:hypothetical protein SSPO_049890 [Streptomyces antimycoticus]|uniref:Uncharacterized protein n=1 Tax=Streptomyces antimycoticus TaxID=68175 RepID=A0A499UYC5_9ACTN|nr:hypothetical protein SSPO_049890 [Streptomyces antimycoticus]
MTTIHLNSTRPHGLSGGSKSLNGDCSTSLVSQVTGVKGSARPVRGIPNSEAELCCWLTTPQPVYERVAPGGGAAVRE